MATSLKEERQKLQLTAEEEQVVIADDEDDVHRKNQQMALCLLGRLRTDSSFNVKAMKSMFCNIRKLSKGIVMRELDTNLFAF